MNRTLTIAATAFFAASPALFAQTSAPAYPAAQNQAQDHAKRHSADPQRTAARMARQLNLSHDQTARLEPILAARREKVQALRSDTTLSPVQRKAQMKSLKQNTRLQMANVLSPEQMKQLHSMRRRHKGENSAPAGV